MSHHNPVELFRVKKNQIVSNKWDENHYVRIFLFQYHLQPSWYDRFGLRNDVLNWSSHWSPLFFFWDLIPCVLNFQIEFDNEPGKWCGSSFVGQWHVCWMVEDCQFAGESHRQWHWTRTNGKFSFTDSRWPFKSYEDNLYESGLHGALILDNSFNVDYVYEALRIDESRSQTNRKHIEDEIKTLKKSKT